MMTSKQLKKLNEKKLHCTVSMGVWMVAAIFLISGASKLFSYADSVDFLANYTFLGFDPSFGLGAIIAFLMMIVAYVIPVAELVAGVLTFVPSTRNIGASLMALLLGLFTVAHVSKLVLEGVPTAVMFVVETSVLLIALTVSAYLMNTVKK